MTPDQIKAWVELARLPKPEAPSLYTETNSEYRGQWYVCCGNPNSDKAFGSYYLHSDGKVYEGCDSGNGEMLGWFKTKEDAEAAIKLYYKLIGLELLQ